MSDFSKELSVLMSDFGSKVGQLTGEHLEGARSRETGTHSRLGEVSRILHTAGIVASDVETMARELAREYVAVRRERDELRARLLRIQDKASDLLDEAQG